MPKIVPINNYLRRKYKRMKINIDVVLKSPKGEILKFQDESGSTQDLTLKECMFRALLNYHPDKDKNLSSSEKFKLGKIADHVYKSVTETELTAEEVSLIKERINLAYAQSVVFAAYNAIEGTA